VAFKGKDTGARQPSNEGGRFEFSSESAHLGAMGDFDALSYDLVFHAC